jgi:hypothetical protein
MQTPKKKTNLSVSTMLFVGVLGLLIGVAGAVGASMLISEPARTVNVVCESFEGPQGPAGADGTDGRDGRNTEITFTHVPALEGLFHEQNVQIELQPIN